MAAFAAAAVSVPDAPGASVLNDASREALEQHVWPEMGAELLQSIREDADRVVARLLVEGRAAGCWLRPSARGRCWACIPPKTAESSPSWTATAGS